MSGPEQRDEHRHENDPTGNGIVNHGPEKTPHTDPDRPHEGSAGPEPGETPEPAPPAADAGAEDAAEEATAETASDGSGTGKDPGSSGAPDDDDLVGTLTDLFARDRGAPASDELDEVALRRMLHGAVRELAPSEGTLDHLHRAVPARRARRRQAVVGAAAAALLIGTAVPAFVHVATSDGPSAARPAIAGHGEQAQGGNGDESGPEAPGRMDRGAHRAGERGQRGRGRPGPQPHQGRGQRPRRRGDGRGDRLPGRGFRLPAGLRPEPARRRVRGYRRTGSRRHGLRQLQDRQRVRRGLHGQQQRHGGLHRHRRGRPAEDRRGPARRGRRGPRSARPLAGAGHGAAEAGHGVRGAVRLGADRHLSDRGPLTEPDTVGGRGGRIGRRGGTDQTSGVDTQSLYEDGGATAEGSVAVTHTPETGAPTAETKIPNACSGTIYRTGVLATS